MVAWNNLGVLLNVSGDAEQALIKVSKALELPLAQRPSTDRAFLSCTRMQALMVLGEFARARAALPESMTSAIRAGLTTLIGDNALYAALVSLDVDDHVGAAVWLGLHEKILREMGSRRVPPESDLHGRYLGDLRQKLGVEAHLRCTEFGGAMSNAEVLRWVVDSFRPEIYAELSAG